MRIRERIFFVEELDELDCKVDLSNPSHAIGSYQAINKDGIRISEWTVSLGEIQVFLNGHRSM